MCQKYTDNPQSQALYWGEAIGRKRYLRVMKENKPDSRDVITENEWEAVESALCRFERPECLETISIHIRHHRVITGIRPARIRLICRLLQAEFGFRKVILHPEADADLIYSFRIQLEGTLEAQLHHRETLLPRLIQRFLLSHWHDRSERGEDEDGGINLI